MIVRVNGEARDVPQGTTVQDLLGALGIPGEATVVERNGAILARALHSGTALAPDDRLEIVRFVGGG